MREPRRGYLTFVQGKEYLRMAYAQALSVRATQTHNGYAIVVDEDTMRHVQSHHHYVFDHIIPTTYKDNPFMQEWQAYQLTPWEQTIKLDVDMLLTHSIDHLWQHLAQHDIVLCNHVQDFRGKKITSRVHRKLFDDNLLPDVYSAMTYFKKSKLASEFYYYAERLSKAWNEVKLRKLAGSFVPLVYDSEVRTDELYAVCARIIGVENVTLPVPLLSFVHGKSELWGLGSRPWHEQLYTQWDGGKLRIGQHVQTNPFHYHYKEWLTDDTIKHLKQRANNT